MRTSRGLPMGFSMTPRLPSGGAVTTTRPGGAGAPVGLAKVGGSLKFRANEMLLLGVSKDGVLVTLKISRLYLMWTRSVIAVSLITGSPDHPQIASLNIVL